MCIGGSWNRLFAGTSRSLRRSTLLCAPISAPRALKKGDLSRFIEDAVRWRNFNRTVQEIKSRNADADADELQAIIDRTVREARAERRTKKKG